HHSRFRPLSTVNFVRNARRPVSSPAGTISSDGITSLVVWPTAVNYSVIPSEVEESGGVTFRLRLGQLRRRSAHHVNKVHSQLAESSMANKSARGPGNAAKYHSVAIVGATNRRSINVANTNPSALRRPLRRERACQTLKPACRSNAKIQKLAKSAGRNA